MSRSRRQPLLLLASLFASLLLPACGSEPQAGAGNTAQPVHAAPSTAHQGHTPGTGATALPQVTPPPPVAASGNPNPRIALFQFNPATIIARVGVPVTWTNTDQIEHSVTHGTPAAPGGAFDSGLFTQGQVFSFTFTGPGEFAYFCTRHPSMAGVVQVLG